MPSERDILQLLRDIQGRLDGDVSLTAIAARAGWSPFHFHRAFRRVTGETPKQYTQRLRLEHAATRLVTGAEATSVAATSAAGTGVEVADDSIGVRVPLQSAASSGARGRWS